MERNDLLSGLILIALSGVLWVMTSSFPELDNGYPGPALFPRIIAVALGLAGTVMWGRSMRPYRRTPSSETANQLPAWPPLLRMGIGIAAIASYPLLIQYVHFVPVMAGLILLFGILLQAALWKAAATAVVSAGLIYGLFTYLLGIQFG